MNHVINTQKLIRQIDEVTQSQVILIEQAEEKERKRMAQNLHDDIAGSIASCVNYLRMLSIQFEGDNKTSKDLKSIANMMEDSYEAVRTRSHKLFLSGGNSQFLDKLEEQVNLLTVGANMRVNLCAELEDAQLLTEVKTTILLVLKEAITNIVKYSTASEVEILLYLDKDDLCLEITDNGKGFSYNKDMKTLGLKSIHERARRLNGNCNILTKYQKGVSIIINIPLKFATANVPD